MVVICKMAQKRGLKCDHKRNTQTPEGISTEYCAIGASIDQCIYSVTVKKWAALEGQFELSEVSE